VISFTLIDQIRQGMFDHPRIGETLGNLVPDQIDSMIVVGAPTKKKTHNRQFLEHPWNE